MILNAVPRVKEPKGQDVFYWHPVDSRADNVTAASIEMVYGPFLLCW